MTTKIGNFKIKGKSNKINNSVCISVHKYDKIIMNWDTNENRILNEWQKYRLKMRFKNWQRRVVYEFHNHKRLSRPYKNDVITKMQNMTQNQRTTTKSDKRQDCKRRQKITKSAKVDWMKWNDNYKKPAAIIKFQWQLLFYIFSKMHETFEL